MLLEVVAAQPDNAEALNSLGLCHSRLLDYDTALEWFERAIAVDRQFALAHFNRGLILLKLGRWQQGWPEYEWRWQLPNFTPFRCPQPQWRGEDIAGQRLLVHSEQGNGDHIQFWRYLALARERCRELIYVGPDKLAELVAGVAGVDESRVPGNIPRDRFDVFVPLMNLPNCLGLDTPLTMAAPYVQVPAHVSVPKLAGARKVGFVWQGSPTHKDDRRRSVPLSALRRLFAVDGIERYALQFPLSGAELEQLRADGVRDLSPDLNGYARTAAYVDQLDLVISVDTATAHLAGALGRPVWLLLATDADWRWGLEGETTPWYPSARLFRQAPGEDWPALLERVADALVQWQGEALLQAV